MALCCATESVHLQRIVRGLFEREAVPIRYLGR